MIQDDSSVFRCTGVPFIEMDEGQIFGSRVGNHDLSLGNAELGVVCKRCKWRCQGGSWINDSMAQRGGQSWRVNSAATKTLRPFRAPRPDEITNEVIM